MKLNPVYKKELMVHTRTIKMSMILFIYNFLLATIALFSFYITFQNFYYYPMDYGDMLVIYMVLAIIEFSLVLFIVPAFTAGSISGERERQTLEILLATKMKPMQIILGKLAASISRMLLLVFSSLPILAIIFSIGGITFFNLMELMFLVFVIAIYIGSIGVFCSVLFKRTTPSTVVTYCILIGLTVGTTVLVWGGNVLCGLRITEYSMESYKGVGHFVLIMLVNPAFTVASLLTSQLSSESTFISFIELFGKTNTYIVKYWFAISIIIQLIISAILLRTAARLLNPLRVKKKKEF